MSLLDIFGGAAQGAASALRTNHELREQERQLARQAAYDQMQRDQFALQKEQAELNRQQAAMANQRANAATRAQGIELARSGVLSDKNALNQYYRDAGLDVEQVPGQATMQLSPLMQMALGRKSLTSNNLTGPDGQRVMQDRDYAAGQYGAVRSQQLADDQRKQEARDRALAAERAWREKMARGEQAASLRRVQVQEAGSNQRAQSDRQFAPMFDTIVGGDGYYWTVDKRTGKQTRTPVKAPPRSSLDAFGGGDTEALAQEAISRLMSGK